MNRKAGVAGEHARRNRPRRSTRIWIVVGCAAAFTAGCAEAGGSSMPGYVNGVPRSALAFAQCMRAHGVPSFPDPSGGQFHLNGIDQNAPRFRHAAGICAPSGQGTSASQQSQALAKGLALSRCMRAHGVRGYPDPSWTGTAGNGSVTIRISPGSGVDPQSPAYQAAWRACRSLVRNSGSGNGSGGSAG